MKLIYPNKFEIPDSMHIKYKEYNLSPKESFEEDMLRACKFKGSLIVTYEKNDTVASPRQGKTFIFKFNNERKGSWDSKSYEITIPK